jgi:hypothetical protein
MDKKSYLDKNSTQKGMIVWQVVIGELHHCLQVNGAWPKARPGQQKKRRMYNGENMLRRIGEVKGIQLK